MLTAFPLFLTQAQRSELSPQRAPLTLPLLPLMCLIQRLAAQSQQMAAAPLSPSPTAQNHESWHKGVKQVMAVTGFWGDIKALWSLGSLPLECIKPMFWPVAGYNTVRHLLVWEFLLPSWKLQCGAGKTKGRQYFVDQSLLKDSDANIH